MYMMMSQPPELLTKKQVCVETAFVGLINDDAAVLGKQEIFLQLPQQDTICHELQGCPLAHLAIIAYLHMHTMFVIRV